MGLEKEVIREKQCHEATGTSPDFWNDYVERLTWAGGGSGKILRCMVPNTNSKCHL